MFSDQPYNLTTDFLAVFVFVLPSLTLLPLFADRANRSSLLLPIVSVSPLLVTSVSHFFPDLPLFADRPFSIGFVSPLFSSSFLCFSIKQSCSDIWLGLHTRELELLRLCLLGDGELPLFANRSSLLLPIVSVLPLLVTSVSHFFPDQPSLLLPFVFVLPSSSIPTASLPTAILATPI